MTIQWGSQSGHMQVGVEVTQSPATVDASTMSVTLSFRVVARTVKGWYYTDNQTAVLTGCISTSIDYRKADPSNSTSNWDTEVGTRSVTVDTSASTSVSKSLNVAITGVADGSAPKVSVTWTVPQRPSSSTTTAPGGTTSDPAPAPTGEYGQWRVTGTPGGFLNVRDQPNTSSTILGKLAEGDIVTGLKDPGTGWVGISDGQWAGRWASGDYLVLVPADTATSSPSGSTTTTTAPSSPPPPVVTPDAPSSWTGVSPVQNVPVEVSAPPDTSRMDLIPASAMLMWGSGDYDSNPYAASDGKQIVVVWRHAWHHAYGDNGRIMTATSTDNGRSYSSPTELPFPLPAGCEYAPVGLAWDASRKLFVMVIHWLTRDTRGGSVTRRWNTIRTSADGVSWSDEKTIPISGWSWTYGNTIIADQDGRWIFAGYGVPEGESRQACFTMVTTDAGQSWSSAAKVTGLPALDMAEPKITRLKSGAFNMLMRETTTGSTVHRAVSVDGVSWSWAGQVMPNVTGNPDVCTLPDGKLLSVVRQQPVVDDTHGRWAWAWSQDNGASWTIRTDFADQSRYMMYGALVPLADGSVACAFASEDDPDRLWKSSSVWFTRFVTQKLTTGMGFFGFAAYLSVETADRMPVTRVRTDAWTGKVVEDTVRVRSFDRYTSWDFEVQQGETVTYRAGSRVTEPVTAPILPCSVLVHPLEPDTLSLPIEVVTDAKRSYNLDAQVTELPGLRHAIVTKSGGRHAAQGETTFRTLTLDDKRRVLRLFEDGTPLFWSHHPGMDMPDWVQPLDLDEERATQMCGHPGHGSEIGEWRTWTMKWVEVKRPSAAGLPRRRRIEELNYTLQSMTFPIKEL